MPRQKWFDKIRSSWRMTMLLTLFGVLLAIIAAWFPLPSLSQPVAAPAQTTAAYPQVELALDLTIVAIDAEITQTTQVSVRTIDSLLEEIEFQLPVTEFAAIEQAIAQELRLPPSTIHQLIRYRLDTVNLSTMSPIEYRTNAYKIKQERIS